MAPVGLLLAVLGNVIGTYAGLLVAQVLSGLAAMIVARLSPLRARDLAVPARTLVVGCTSDPVTLDPHRATDLVCRGDGGQRLRDARPLSSDG